MQAEKYPDSLQNEFTQQNIADSKVFGYTRFTLDSGFKIFGDANNTDRFYLGFTTCV